MNNSIENGQKSGHFSKEDKQIYISQEKKMLNTVIFRKMTVKNTIRYHLTPVRMVII